MFDLILRPIQRTEVMIPTDKTQKESRLKKIQKTKVLNRIAVYISSPLYTDSSSALNYKWKNIKNYSSVSVELLWKIKYYLF